MALIYDIGMHTCEDTAFYLHQGHKVVALEAVPSLAEKARTRFQREVEEGRLIVLNCAVAARAGEMDFWVCDDHSEWSSFNQKVASRNGSRHHSIKVKTARFAEILSEFGRPEYLKLDIEGNEHLCLLDLSERNRPRYVSVEDDGASFNPEGDPRNLMLLRECGYERFKLIWQPDFWPLAKSGPYSGFHGIVYRILYSDSLRIRLIRKLGTRTLASPFDVRSRLERRNQWKFPQSSSGPWGEGTLGRWLTFSEAREIFHWCRGRSFWRSFWFDWHAKLS
ncbi:MAG: FkbM family methyltransferase [Terriglobia bacterium]